MKLNSLKIWVLASTSIVLTVFAVNVSAMEVNTQKDTTMSSQSMHLTKGQYMMPGRCWTDCCCESCHEKYV